MCGISRRSRRALRSLSSSIEIDRIRVPFIKGVNVWRLLYGLSYRWNINVCQETDQLASVSGQLDSFVEFMDDWKDLLSQLGVPSE